MCVKKKGVKKSIKQRLGFRILTHDTKTPTDRSIIHTWWWNGRSCTNKFTMSKHRSDRDEGRSKDEEADDHRGHLET